MSAPYPPLPIYQRDDGYVCFRAVDLPADMVAEAPVQEGEFIVCYPPDEVLRFYPQADIKLK